MVLTNLIFWFGGKQIPHGFPLYQEWLETRCPPLFLPLSLRVHLVLEV